MFVLEVIVQAEALLGEMLANDRHAEIGAVLAAELLGQRIAEMPGLVGAALGFAEQFLPFGTWQALIVEIGARPFTAMVEEADIVVLLFERPDLVFDELIQHGQIIGNVLRDVEIHDAFPPERSPLRQFPFPL